MVDKTQYRSLHGWKVDIDILEQKAKENDRKIVAELHRAVEALVAADAEKAEKK